MGSKTTKLLLLDSPLQESFHTFRVTTDLIMRYVAAALLCSMGEQEVSAANVEKILSSVGVEADKEKLKLVVAACKGKSLDELMAAGVPKLAAMGGGGGAAAPAAGAAAPAAAAEAAPAAAKKEEEPEEDSDGDMGMSLFD